MDTSGGFPVAGDLFFSDEVPEEVVCAQLEAGDWWFGGVDEWLTVATVLSKLSAYFNSIDILDR